MQKDWAALLLLPAIGITVPAHAADYLSVEDAQQVLFPGATGFTEVPVNLTKEQKKAIKKLSGVRQREDTQPVWRVDGPDGTLGWFVVDEVVGKHEYITYAIGLTPDGKVVGIEIMTYRETHGDEVRQDDWRANFVGKGLEASFKLNKDIPNISGATLSCRNITDGVHRVLALQEVMDLHD